MFKYFILLVVLVNWADAGGDSFTSSAISSATSAAIISSTSTANTVPFPTQGSFKLFNQLRHINAAGDGSRTILRSGRVNGKDDVVKLIDKMRITDSPATSITTSTRSKNIRRDYDVKTAITTSPSTSKKTNYRKSVV